MDKQKIPGIYWWGFFVCGAKENRFFAPSQSRGATRGMLVFLASYSRSSDSPNDIKAILKPL